MGSTYTYQNILTKARQLEKDIRNLDIERIQVHESVKSYLRFDLKKLSYVTDCNAFLLHHALKDMPAIDESSVLIDHGAGIGLFALLVKRVGLSCLCHDISPEYIEGIRELGRLLDATPDFFVVGDTMDLVDFCKSNHLHIKALVSRNVIEHLPDYKIFFKELFMLSEQPFTMIFSTSANIHNPMVRHIHRKIHHNYEYHGAPAEMDNPTLNSANCGMVLRKEIIRNEFPNLNEDLLNKLAVLNRGFTKHDILERVKLFSESGVLPKPLPHPSNTCDPYTGVWVERLVPVSDYRHSATDAGFEFQTLKGFYNTHYAKSILNLIALLLNFILKLLPSRHVSLSPFLAMKLTKRC